jgi:hypothetical protein
MLLLSRVSIEWNSIYAYSTTGQFVIVKRKLDFVSIIFIVCQDTRNWGYENLVGNILQYIH